MMRLPTVRRPRAATMLGVLCASLSHAALAADPTAAEATPSQLQDIVVTAERHPEQELKVPLSVSAIDANTLDQIDASGDDIRVLSGRTPSLEIETSTGRSSPRFYIRGLGNSAFDINASQPVSIVYDDVVKENSVVKGFPIFDVDQIEVLRGPQGTLFGRNTPAGVVKIDSARPSDETSGYFSFGDGEYNTLNAEGAVGGAIIPGVLDFRLSVIEQHRDDWITNLNGATHYEKKTGGYDDTAARLQLLYKPTDDLSVLFNLHGRSLGGAPTIFRANIIDQGSNGLVPGFQANQIQHDGRDAQSLTNPGGSVAVTYKLGRTTLTSVTSYEHLAFVSRGDVDGGTLNGPGIIFFPDETSDAVKGLDQFTQELRSYTDITDRLSNQAGLFFFYEHLPVDSLVYNLDGSRSEDVTTDQTNQSYGIFDSVKYAATDALTVGAGIRVSYDHKSYNTTRLFGFTGPTAFSASASGAEPTFDVNASYAITPEVNVYARIASGYQAPSILGRIAFANTISQASASHTTSYEAGVKADLFDRRAKVRLSAYTSPTDDLQLTAVGGTTNNTALVNASHVVLQGFEAEFEVKPVQNLLLTGSASYNFSEIQDGNLSVSSCGAPCTPLNAPSKLIPGNLSINGNPLPNAPRWILNASARYTVPLGEAGDVYFSTDWSFRSSIDYLLYRAKEFDGKSLVLGGMRVGYISHKYNYEVAAYARNILNQVQVVGALDFDNLTGYINDPRIVGGEVKLFF